jgi:filamentous hemagglutinin family protein
MLMIHCLPETWLSFGFAETIVPITPSGLNTHVDLSSIPPTGTLQHNITGGARTGTNLFHSFGEFNVPRNHIANFLNDSGLETTSILGRVTGGNPSSIFGTIQTTGFRNANLFLMNPAGIVFGPTASLNVGGSVTFTTADYLRLNDNVRFNAIPNANADALLSSAPVAAYGFLDSTTGAITVHGSQFKMSEGDSISLIGGNITIQSDTLKSSTVQSAHLTTPGGHINLVSVASSGEILARTLDQAPNINGQSFAALGKIQISEKSVIDASGNGGGTVLIRGGQFVLDNSRIYANVTGSGPITNGMESIGGGIDIVANQNAVIRNLAALETNVTNNATPGATYEGVHVRADRIEILGVLPSDDPNAPLPFTGIRSVVAPGRTGGNSGNIKLEANTTLAKDFGKIETLTEGTGNAGNIIITANQNVEINSGTQINSNSAAASGSGGNIELTSLHGNIILTSNDASVPTLVTTQSNASSGDPGNITVNAPHGDIILSGPGGQLFVNAGTIAGDGGKGQIQFTANNLKLSDGMTISQVNVSPVAVGNMTVMLGGSLSLRGQSKIFTTARASAPAADLNIKAQDVLVTEGSSISTGTTNSGPGGQLSISSSSLELTNGAQITSGSTIGRLPGGRRSVPTGAGGTVIVQGPSGVADLVVIDGQSSGIFSNAEGTGAAGDIFVKASSVSLQNGGTLSAATSGTAPSAKGGSITINATDQVTLTNGASMTARSTGSADAGDISIDAGQRFDMQDSNVTTEATQASGGNIKIKAVDLIRIANSNISSSVQGGPSTAGGNITIDPNTVILQNAQILANANQGNGGNITITTPTFLADQFSLVDASSQFGLNGRVTIQSPTSNLSGTVTQLTSKPTATPALLQNRCVALAGGGQSSFIVAGRDALPSEPGGWLSSPLVMENGTNDEREDVTRLTTKNLRQNESLTSASHITETGVLSLRRLTPPGFLVRTFANGATGCHS